MPVLRPTPRRPEPRCPTFMPMIIRAGEYNKLDFKRPAVLRKGNDVITCYLWEGTRQCLKDACFWPRSGKCSIFSKIVKNGKKKN